MCQSALKACQSDSHKLTFASCQPGMKGCVKERWRSEGSSMLALLTAAGGRVHAQQPSISQYLHCAKRHRCQCWQLQCILVSPYLYTASAARCFCTGIVTEVHLCQGCAVTQPLYAFEPGHVPAQSCRQGTACSLEICLGRVGMKGS